MTGNVIAVIGAIIAITLLGIGLGIAVPALQGSESGAPTNYTDSLALSYVVLGLSPVAIILGLVFSKFAGRR
jgi:hypothetical protein